MDKEKQRIKIAEACGWKDIFIENQELVLGKHEPESMGRDYLDVPDYLNDLNAMHKAEKILKGKRLFFQYSLALSALPQFQGNNHLNTFHATAEQRAEAFLKTLNLWEE